METGPDQVIYRSETRRRIAQSNLKRCPLCNALNARANRVCFVCDWHGSFDHDPFRIEESLIRMIYQDQPVRIESRQTRQSAFSKIRRWVRRHIDMRA